MFEDCTQRLATLGYDYAEQKDKWLLEFLIKKATNYVLVECNIKEIPKDLEPHLVDYVVGEFLMDKKNSGNLDLKTINFDQIAKSIKVGDTDVTFSEDDTPDKKFDALIRRLMGMKRGLLVSYRKLRW